MFRNRDPVGIDVALFGEDCLPFTSEGMCFLPLCGVPLLMDAGASGSTFPRGSVGMIKLGMAYKDTEIFRSLIQEMRTAFHEGKNVMEFARQHCGNGDAASNKS